MTMIVSVVAKNIFDIIQLIMIKKKKNTLKWELKIWFNSSDCQLHLWRIWVQFPAPTWQFKTFYNLRGVITLFRPSLAPAILLLRAGKTPEELRRRNTSQHYKSYILQIYGQHTKWDRVQSISTKIKEDKGVYFYQLFCKVLGFLTRGSRLEKQKV